MRFTVPQFIEIEDKIFGPLTWKQFLYVSGGFGISVVLFMTAHFLVFMLIGLPIALLAAALAFYPVNNRPFSVFLEAMFNYFTGDREFFWQREKDVVYKAKSKTRDEEVPVAPKPAPNSAITSLSRRLELEALQKNDT